MKRFFLAIPLVVGLLLVSGLRLAAQPEVNATRQRLLLAENLEQGELTGRFVERTPGSYVFVPESPNLPAVKVLNPQKVVSASVGVRLTVGATYDAQDKGIELLDYRLQTGTLSSAGHRGLSIPSVPGDVLVRPAIRKVERTLSTFRGKVSEAFKPGAMSADILSPNDNSTITRAVKQATRDLNRTYYEALERGEDGMTERSAAVRGLAEIRQESKAIYGKYENYPPWSYDRIFNNAKSVVAIAESGQTRQALCSGVLVGPDLVLTAGHCFKAHHPKDLEVWFGFAETTEQILPPPIARKITELVAPPSEKHEEFLARAFEERFDAEMQDYAIVRIETSEVGSNPVTVAPQCLRKHHVMRGRGLYVIGYPKGTRETVHDNGRVYLPFSLRPREFEELKRDIEVDFAMLEDDDRLRLLNEFVASYVRSGEGADMVYELYDTRWGSQPKLGIVADLFRGNSGSPVFDRDNHCIVGIHTGGASDTGQRLGASWQTHETVLPIPAILTDLETSSQTSQLVTSGILTIR